MANITGTEGNDVLQGTSNGDAIQGLGGDDRIILNAGGGSVDGGAGNDTIDLSNADSAIYLVPVSHYLYNGERGGGAPKYYSNYINIETIVANPNQKNYISTDRYQTIENVDFVAGRIDFYNQSRVLESINIKNFDNVGSSIIRAVGNDRDNVIGIASTIIGSKGNDTLSGATIDYSKLGRAIKFSTSGTIDKASFGKDTVSNDYLQKIVGSTNKENTIDASSEANVDLNLTTNSFKKNTIYGVKQIEIINFVNAIGSKGNDTIVGTNKNSKLTGGGGNDTICGGTKNDRITGTDSTARGVGEVDTLTGGGGRDKFILGDKNGAYYVGHGNNDYALITDFDLFKDSISVGKLKDYSIALEGNNTIDLFAGKDVNHRDLIAKIQISGGISSVNRNSKSIMGGDSSINTIVSKLDILSGSESERDS